MKATFLKHVQNQWSKWWVYVLWIIHVVVFTCVSMYSLVVLVSLWMLSHASCVCGCRLDAMVSMPCYFSPPFEREGHREREVTMRKRALFLFVTTLSLCPPPSHKEGRETSLYVYCCAHRLDWTRWPAIGWWNLVNVADRILRAIALRLWWRRLVLFKAIKLNGPNYIKLAYST